MISEKQKAARHVVVQETFALKYNWRGVQAASFGDVALQLLQERQHMTSSRERLSSIVIPRAINVLFGVATTKAECGATHIWQRREPSCCAAACRALKLI